MKSLGAQSPARAVVGGDRTAIEWDTATRQGLGFVRGSATIPGMASFGRKRKADPQPEPAPADPTPDAPLDPSDPIVPGADAPDATDDAPTSTEDEATDEPTPEGRRYLNVDSW